MPNCGCVEALAYYTCYPCVDRILYTRLQDPRVTGWELFQARMMRAPGDPPVPDKQFTNPNYAGRSSRSRPGSALKAITAVNTGIMDREQYLHWVEKGPICPCGREIDPAKDLHLYPKDFFEWPIIPQKEKPIWQRKLEGPGMALIDMDETQKPFHHWNHKKPGWTMFCKYCNEIWVPGTTGLQDRGLTPVQEARALEARLKMIDRNPITFKQALELRDWQTEPCILGGPMDLRAKVESVMASRIEDGVLQYQVYWEDTYSPTWDPTWYPASDTRMQTRVVNDWHKENPDQPSPVDIATRPGQRRR